MHSIWGRLPSESSHNPSRPANRSRNRVLLHLDSLQNMKLPDNQEAAQLGFTHYNTRPWLKYLNQGKKNYLVDDTFVHDNNGVWIGCRSAGSKRFHARWARRSSTTRQNCCKRHGRMDRGEYIISPMMSETNKRPLGTGGLWSAIQSKVVWVKVWWTNLQSHSGHYARQVQREVPIINPIEADYDRLAQMMTARCKSHQIVTCLDGW